MIPGLTTFLFLYIEEFYVVHSGVRIEELQQAFVVINGFISSGSSAKLLLFSRTIEPFATKKTCKEAETVKMERVRQTDG